MPKPRWTNIVTGGSVYDRDDSAPALLSCLIGGILGASVACLLAPRSGDSMRRHIRRRLNAGVAGRRAAAERAVPEPGLPARMGRDQRG